MAKDEEKTPPEDESAAEAQPEAGPEEAPAPEAQRTSDTEGDAPASDASASDADASSAAAAPATPKERRRRKRAAKAAERPARPEMSAEERQAERASVRQRKAAVRRGVRVRQREKRRAARTEVPAPVAARPTVRPGTQKTRQGVVVSDRAAKTITVRIDITRRHPMYKKVVRTSSTLHAHDENSEAHIGDTVVVRESRPLSRTKRWRLVEVVERAK